MINESQKVELLAPAKDKECAFAAINAGADAVYIGAEGFGARKKAANSLDDIKEIVDYAHKFNVKIYVTVNTIVYDEELDSVQKLIQKLYDVGVDALIIQDMGILNLDIPPIALHASTQCNIDTADKVKFLESCNIERVVLPRELSIKEIENIRKETDVELEVFIHGALCVCYSGQCYMSASIGGRSANRGECAQPCRKKYSLIDEKGRKISDSKYLLSMKDLCMDSHLEELINLGVSSLKIEGRLKDSDYVKNIVSYYRRRIDSINPSLRPSKGLLINDFKPDLNKTFNRGYTDFNAKGFCEELINPDTPKFLGEKIGKITNIDKSGITINTSKQLSVADGLAFYDEDGELQGTVITKINKNIIQVRNAKALSEGMVVYRNYDAVFNKTLEQTIFKRKIPLFIRISSCPEGFWINLNNEFTYTVTKNYEDAKNTVKARENLISQFSKTGDSEFITEHIDVCEEFSSFIPISELNEIRRNFLEEYRIFRNTEYKRNKRIRDFKPSEFPIRELDYTFNVSNQKAKELYESAGAKIIQAAYEKCGCGERLILTKHCIRRHLDLCLKNNPKHNETLYLVDEYNKKYKLDFDCKNCKMKIINYS